MVTVLVVLITVVFVPYAAGIWTGLLIGRDRDRAWLPTDRRRWRP